MTHTRDLLEKRLGLSHRQKQKTFGPRSIVEVERAKKHEINVCVYWLDGIWRSLKRIKRGRNKVGGEFDMVSLEEQKFGKLVFKFKVSQLWL